MKAVMIYPNFLDHSGDKRVVGGVETYLWNLSKVCLAMGLEPILLQRANHTFQKQVEHLLVRGIDAEGLSRNRMKALCYKMASSLADRQKDLIIFGADHISVCTSNRRAIAIQHGVSWDLPLPTQGVRGKVHWARWLEKRTLIKQAIRDFNNCYNRVCVDHNFLNWYRATMVDEPQGNVWVIPNSVEVHDNIRNRFPDNGSVRIIFARRFVPFRGTRLVAHAMLELMQTYSNIRLTFAGEGRDETYLRTLFAQHENVDFARYMPEQVSDVLSDYDIAVVPSIGSEGTTFSVSEAMAAGVAVVATPVGGITNMVIDGYNGMLASPTQESLRFKMEVLITDPEFRRKLARKGYETAKCAFNLETWKDSWRAVLTRILDGDAKN